MPEPLPEKNPAVPRESPLGREVVQTSESNDEGNRSLAALSGQTDDRDLYRRAQRVLRAMCVRQTEPQTAEEVQSGFRKFLVALGHLACEDLLLEAYQAAEARNIPTEHLATFLKNLPSQLAPRFSPYYAVHCLKDGVTAQDITTAWDLQLEVPQDTLGNRDLAIMLHELCALPGWRSLSALCDFSRGRSPFLITIGKSDVDPASSPNLLRGVLVYAKDQGKNPTTLSQWRKVIDQYGRSLREYIIGDRTPHTVLYLSSDEEKNNPDSAFAYNLDLLREGLTHCAPKAKITDVSHGGIQELLQQARAYVAKNPGKPFLVYIALHGNPDGSAVHPAGDVTPEHFQELAAISPNITVQVDGCFAGVSLPSAGPGTFLLGSSISRAYALYQQEFSKALSDKKNDLDGDGKVGWREARLAVFLRWRKSFLPTSFVGKNGQSVRLAAADRPSGNTSDAPQA